MRNMDSATLPKLTSGGHELDLSPQAFGWLRDSSSVVGNAEELQHRMDQDGSLFLPGFLNRADVITARRAICQVLSDDGLTDPDAPVEAAIAREGIEMYFRADIANQSAARAPIHEVIYGPSMMDLTSSLLGGPSRHFDYTWLRAIAPGKGTFPHCDSVYMNRGARDVYTAWVPFGDIPLTTGGLIVIENSHRDEQLRNEYCPLDVDTVCSIDEKQNILQARGYQQSGAISNNIRETRDQLGGRILTCEEFRMGDLLLFSIYLAHGSLDNRSKEIRISTDSRYQLASEPTDERWFGENPASHGGSMVRNAIC